MSDKGRSESINRNLKKEEQRSRTFYTSDDGKSIKLFSFQSVSLPVAQCEVQGHGQFIYNRITAASKRNLRQVKKPENFPRS